MWFFWILLVWENSDKKLLCICFLWFTFVWIFTRKMFSINHYVLVVQYFCQWLHYDNLLRTSSAWILNNYLFSLTSKILGSYMWVFTVYVTELTQSNNSIYQVRSRFIVLSECSDKFVVYSSDQARKKILFMLLVETIEHYTSGITWSWHYCLLQMEIEVVYRLQKVSGNPVGK